MNYLVGFDEECDKENVCPVETMEIEVDSQCTTEVVDSARSDVETDAVIPQEKHPDKIKEESVSAEAIDVCFSGTDEKSEEQSEETVCTSDNSNATVETTPTSSTAEENEGEIIKASLPNKIQRGGRGKAAQKSKNANNDKAKAPAVLSVTEEENLNGSLPSSPPRARRGKKLLEVPEVAASPVRKSARGRIPKHRFVDEEAKNTEASQVSVDSMKTEIPECPPVVTKTRRGRKAKQDDGAAIEPVDDINASDPQCPDAPANEELVQAPVVKSGRRKKLDKPAIHPSEELEQKTHEIVCEENAVAPESVKLVTSLVTETVSATRARRGRTAKKEHLKTEPSLTLESEITSTHAAVEAEKPLTPAAKSGRGRKAKNEMVKEQPLDYDDAMVVSQTVAEVNVDHKDEPEAPVVKSGRGRKAKQQKPQMAEEVDHQPAVDASTHVPMTEEHTETEVKSVRSSRKTKQSKTEENVVNLVEQAETPVVKSGRKRAVTAKETAEVEAEVSVKRGRRAVAEPAPPVAVVSSRGRKAVAKVESEVTKDVASSEEPAKPVKHTRRTPKVPESKKEENPMAQAGSELVAAENTAIVALEKVERGSRGRKQKDSTKSIPNNPINEISKAEEASEIKPSKNLVVSKNTEEFEPSANVEEQQLKKPKRLGKIPAEMSSTSNQSTDLPPRGRRGAKKEEEHPVEEVQIKIKPLRRGKAVGSAAPKSDPSDSKASTPLKRKRNDVLEVTDESSTKEPLPKKRGRVAISTKVATEVSSKKKTPDAEPEKAEANPKKAGNRAVRGQKKTAQEPDPAPAQESVSGKHTVNAVLSVFQTFNFTLEVSKTWVLNEPDCATCDYKMLYVGWWVRVFLDVAIFR